MIKIRTTRMMRMKITRDINDNVDSKDDSGGGGKGDGKEDDDFTLLIMILI